MIDAFRDAMSRLPDSKSRLCEFEIFTLVNVNRREIVVMSNHLDAITDAPAGAPQCRATRTR
ncbi:MAG: hypothetical protein ACKOBR_09580, partial [Actinomycetota bacterium]